MTQPLIESKNANLNESRIPVNLAVIRFLSAVGINTIFGNPGSTELGLFKDFPDDFNYVLGLHEGVVVGMADGHAQASRNAAVVNLHSAAGVGNAMGAIFTAYKNRTPLIILAGQQSRSLLPYDPFLFSSQAPQLAQPYVKWGSEPARAEDVPQVLARAYYMAMQPPCGPVLISVPADDWSKLCEPVAVRQVGYKIEPDTAIIGAINKQLSTSQRPAFVVGSGVDRDDAWLQVQQLAELHNAAVWQSPMSGRRGFAEDHPQFCGHLAPSREKIVSALSPYDFVLVIGTPAFKYHVEGEGPFIPNGTKLALLTDDPEVISWAPQGMAALGSVNHSVERLLKLCSKPAGSFIGEKRMQPVPEPSIPMSTDFVLNTLANVRSRDSVIVEEAPSARRVMHNYLPILEPETFYTMSSGGLGFGVPAAVGVAMAKPATKVIALIGDGSSLYSFQGIWNAVQLNLPITFIILKNKKYAALQKFGPVYGFGGDSKLPGTDLNGIDFLSLANAFGCKAVKVSKPAELESMFKKYLNYNLPVLIEVDIA